MDNKKVDEEREFTYLVEAYTAALAYFDGISGRVNNRFNILLTANLLLAVVLGNAFLAPQPRSACALMLIWAFGTLIAVFLYLQSVRDKYLISMQIDRINIIRTRIEEYTPHKNLPTLFLEYKYVDTSEHRNKWWYKITMWDSKVFSLTRLPAWLSLCLILFWLLAFIVGIVCGT
jgi:hypothetical protein